MKKHIKLRVEQDIYSESPRGFFEDVTKMVCFHKRYSLGDKHDYNVDDYNSWEELKQVILENEDVVAIKPIYLYDHSTLAMSTAPFGCRWDSGQVGFIYATKEFFEDIDVAEVENVLDQDIRLYDLYLRGEVYRFELIDAESGDVLDSMSGFYLTDDFETMIAEMSDHVEEVYWDLFEELKKRESIWYIQDGVWTVIKEIDVDVD